MNIFKRIARWFRGKPKSPYAAGIKTHKQPGSRKLAIYTMGSPDPRGFAKAKPTKYSFCSGIDVKGYILNPLSEIDPLEPIGEGMISWMLGASFGLSENGGFKGTLLGIVFQSMQDYHKLLGKQKRFILKWANKNGDVAILYDGIIQFENILQWGIGIDDLVVEAQLNFTQISQKLDLGEDDE
jgi:hypothetical protein